MATPPPTPRSPCPIAASLDLFGDRWTLLVLRDLLIEGRANFSEFATQEGIATNILADRLQRLLVAGVVVRARDPEDGRRWVYHPTEAAVALVPALIELVLWGSQYTAGRAPEPVLGALAHDKAGFIAQVMAGARERVPTD